VAAFRRLFEDPNSLDVEVGRAARGSWSSGITAANIVRRRERDELLLAPNAELAKILRRAVGVGLAMSGPLPSIDVLATDRPLSVIPTTLPAGTVAEMPSEWKVPYYLRSLGRNELVEPFRNDWIDFAQLDRDDHYRFGGFQLLASRDTHRSAETGEVEEDKFSDALWRVVNGLAPLVALDGFFSTTRSLVSSVRATLLPILRAESEGKAALRNVEQGHLLIAKANGIAFRQELVRHELSKPGTSGWIRLHLPELHAKGEPAGDRLDTAMWKGFEYRTKNLASDLDLFRSAFRELLSYTVMVVNDRLQRTVLRLTVLAIALAVFALVPEQIRGQWIETAFAFARKMLRR